MPGAACAAGRALRSATIASPSWIATPRITPDDALLYNSSYLRPEAGRAQSAPRLRRVHARLPAAVPARRARISGSITIGRVSLLDQETFLVSILHRQDKMSMAAAIESRVPFMDYRIVEFANRLPTRATRSGAASGKAHRQGLRADAPAGRDRRPAEVRVRRAAGALVPRGRRAWATRIAALPDSPAADVFDRAALRVWSPSTGPARDHSELLWTALNLCTWRETFRC